MSEVLVKKSYRPVWRFSLAVVAAIAAFLAAGAGWLPWSATAAGVLAIAAIAWLIFNRPYTPRHRARTVDNLELGAAVAEGEEAISLVEHLNARLPEALELADIQALSQAALEYAAARLPVTDALLLDIRDENVQVRLGRGRARVYGGKRFRISETVKSRLDEKKILVFPDLRSPDYADMRAGFPAILTEAGIRSLVLAKTDETGGVLALASTKRYAFTAEDVAFLRSVSAQLAYVCWVESRLRAADVELKKTLPLMGFIDDLLRSHEAGPAVEAALTWAADVLGATSGLIMVADRRQAVLNPVASIGLAAGERLAVLKVGEGVAGWVAKTKKPIVLEDIPDTRTAAPAESVGYSVYFPVLVRDRTWAVVSLGFAPAAPRLDREVLADVRRTIERVMLLAEPFFDALDLRSTHIDTIRALVEVSESRDRWRNGHAKRVRELAEVAGRRLHLDSEDLRSLEVASLLHAFGYLAVDPTLLTANRALDRRELAQIHSHAAITADSLNGAPEMARVIPIVRHHHEHFDGSGYNGLRGDQIPFGARILAVVDAYEAMTSPRPHRPAMSKDQAVSELNRQAGVDFDPRVVDVVSEIVANPVTWRR